MEDNYPSQHHSWKTKVLSFVGGMAALVLVVGIAAASYFVSNRLSGRTSVAPNAPESKPMASAGNCQFNTTELTCENDSECAWYLCVHKCYAKGTNTSSVCAGCIDQGKVYCGGCIDGCRTISNKTCSQLIEEECNNGSSSSSSSSSGSSGGPSCTSDKRDQPSSNSITFSRTGKVFLFSRNLAGTVTLTGPKTITIPATTGEAVKQTTSFTVVAGETYNIKVKIGTETNDSYGWRPPKATNICGPINDVCGGSPNITPLTSLATANSDVSGIISSGPANIQCWGDALINDQSQDYDYNDFTLVFGYENISTIPNCKNISGPSTLTVGEMGTYTAIFEKSASNGLTDGEIFISYVINNTDQKNIVATTPSSKKPVAGGGTISGDFTPTTAGKYWLRCRAWNDGIAECRPPSVVDGPPRFPCAGPGYEMLVTVSEPVAPKCIMSKTFVLTNNVWTSVENKELKPGMKVRFGAMVDLSTAKKARFKINGGEWQTSENKMTVENNTVFYIEHTLKSGNYSVESEIQ